MSLLKFINGSSGELTCVWAEVVEFVASAPSNTKLFTIPSSKLLTLIKKSPSQREPIGKEKLIYSTSNLAIFCFIRSPPKPKAEEEKVNGRTKPWEGCRFSMFCSCLYWEPTGRFWWMLSCWCVPLSSPDYMETCVLASGPRCPSPSRKLEKTCSISSVNF